MKKRQFYAKALLVCLPMARELLPAQVRRDSSYMAEQGGQRIAAIAAQLAEAATLEYETQMVIWDDSDADPANRLDPEYVDSRRDPDSKEGGANN